MNSSSKKNSFLVSGEAGVGKSFFIRQEAKNHNAKLFRWNVRIDRSLREGREILHQQVRSKEPLYVWIEGADDLTQEAQAFLRRILETSSVNVVSMLEVREPWKLSPPIISRCIPINMTSKYSFRSVKNSKLANQYNLIPIVKPLKREDILNGLSYFTDGPPCNGWIKLSTQSNRDIRNIVNLATRMQSEDEYNWNNLEKYTHNYWSLIKNINIFDKYFNFILNKAIEDNLYGIELKTNIGSVYNRILHTESYYSDESGKTFPFYIGSWEKEKELEIMERIINEKSKDIGHTGTKKLLGK
jgi:hypothetical protein